MVNIEDLVKQHQEVEAAAAHGEMKKKKGYDNVKMEDMEQDFLSSRKMKPKPEKKERSKETPKSPEGKTGCFEKPEKTEKIEKPEEKKTVKRKKSKERSMTEEADKEILTKASVPTTTKTGSNESTSGGKGSKDTVTKTSAGATEEPAKGRRDGSANCCSIL